MQIPPSVCIEQSSLSALVFLRIQVTTKFADILIQVITKFADILIQVITKLFNTFHGFTISEHNFF